MTHHVWYSDGPFMPQLDPAVAVEIARLRPNDDLLVTLGWVLEPRPWFATRTWPGSIQALMPGHPVSGAVHDGTLQAVPTLLSDVPDLIRRTRIDLAVVEGCVTPRGISHGTSVGTADILARQADKVIVELHDSSIDFDAPLIEGNIVGTVPRPGAAPFAARSARSEDERFTTIGKSVARILPDDATIQLGIGGVLDSVADHIDRPVHVLTGVMTPALAGLMQRGLLVGPAIAAYAMVSPETAALAQARMLALQSVTTTHDRERYARLARFVSCNTALQVGFDGSVNVERIGGRVVAGVGGHRDFCRAARTSPGGISMIAVAACGAAGTSRIVAEVEHVSTPGSLIDIVVTEFGIADLRETTYAQRRARLIDIAAPEHRNALRTQWPAVSG